MLSFIGTLSSGFAPPPHGVSAVPPPQTVMSNSQITVGDVRVTALSDLLVRVEPKGPNGFEDRATFTAVGRNSFAGVPIAQTNSSSAGVTLSTAHYSVLLRPPSPPPTCDAPLTGTDVVYGKHERSLNFAEGAAVADRAACCAACESDATCTAWVYASSSAPADGVVQPSRTPEQRWAAKDVPGANCWPLAWFEPGATAAAAGRDLGCSAARATSCAAGRPSFAVHDAAGALLYDTDAARDADSPAENLLHFPSPLAQKGYALVDYPRFYAPPWGAAPMPKGTPSATNGYDFENNVFGDTYVFALGDDVDAYGAARSAVVGLTGPTPLLPDFAYGTWFTWWHSYNESEAKDDVARWESGGLPIDVWALDMNWRNTSDHQDWYYNHPASQLFANFTEWFEFLKSKKLRTYFNDHPYPVAMRNAGGLQTSAEEVAFRWEGLSEWMAKGLTYWWFDHNWGFSIPPPFVNSSKTSHVWQGLDNAAWGSHIYYSSVEHYDKTVRDAKGDAFYGGRPMTLTKFGLPDWRPGMDAAAAAESPAQHRFPVWWTGDGVNLQASVQSMVDSGVHGFKPFVHSDCGGDYRPPNGGDLLRWTAHCVFGTVLRFHGNNHKPWSYDAHIEDVVKSYLETRYQLLPSLIAGGAEAAASGFPLVARGDLFWPDHPEAASNDQYLWLNDTLVAPVFDSSKNETTRDVWIPPGSWVDAWNGSAVTGPATLSVTQPYERQPMWHRSGGFVVLAPRGATRVDAQDWSHLVVDAHPAAGAAATRRHLAEKGTGARTPLAVSTDGAGGVAVDIGALPTARKWTVRLHLRPGQRVVDATLDGAPLAVAHIAPLAAAARPFRGAGAAPPPLAGAVAELELPAAAAARSVAARIVDA